MPRRVASPGQFLQRIVNAGNDPHIAVKRADRRAAIGEKVEAAEKTCGHSTGFGNGSGERIDDIRAVAGATRSFGDDWLVEMWRAAFAKRGQVRCRCRLFQVSPE